MAKKTTIYDIAKALNVTSSTVSRALNNSELISESTRNMVLKMAKELNYRPNKLASSLSSGKTYIIGVIIPSARINFFSLLVSHLEQTLKKEGYSIILYQSNESKDSEVNGVKTLLEAQVDGIVISPSLETESFEFLENIKQENKPVIVFDRVVNNLQVPQISIDDEDAGYLVTKHLLDQEYKKIAYITTNSKIKIFEDRMNGYLRALKEASIPVKEEYVIKKEVSIEAGIEGTKKLLQLKDKPDAIIGGDDFTALGIIHELQSKNVLPPQIAVAGFANQQFSAYITPSLTTIDQKAATMGTEVAKLLLALLDSRLKSKVKSDYKMVIHSELIVRESSKRK